MTVEVQVVREVEHIAVTAGGERLEILFSADVADVIAEVGSFDIVGVTDETAVVAETEITHVVSIGQSGPPGPAGASGSEEEMPYAKRADFVGDTTIYKGQAAPGAADSAPVWRIARLTIAGDGDVTEHWAGGTADFNKAWDDRAALSYS